MTNAVGVAEFWSGNEMNRLADAIADATQLLRQEVSR